MPDRIEAGSYACAAAITGGSLELAGARKETMPSILSGLQDAGLTIEDMPGGIKVSANGPTRPLSLSTAPFPAFPTDMQAQRSEEHTSELQSLMRISYAVFCLKKKK